MSGYEGKDLLTLAHEAERDLNSTAAKQGHDLQPRTRGAHGASESTTESGVDDNVENKFVGAKVTYGSAASGAGDNRDIPLEEGGSVNPTTGKLYKARDYEGEGGPEDKARSYARDNGGNDDVRGAVRSEGGSLRQAQGEQGN